jgi:hypothetical protein
MEERRLAMRKSSLAAMPAFNKVQLASSLQAVVQDVVSDVHQSIVTDFMPIYDAKQREQINQAFEKLGRQLKKTVGADAIDLAEFINRRTSRL